MATDRLAMYGILLLILSASMTVAEYRVFQLRIVNDKTNDSRVVHTTLDWLQYPQYHHLKRDERIEVLDYWMCWKRADNLTPLCKRPVTEDTLKSDSEASEEPSL